MVYDSAIICDKWNLDFHIKIQAENDVEKHNRSYMHYISEHTPLVAAKCWATKWALESINSDIKYTVREYFAGVGIMTTIIQGLFDISHHVANELDKKCVEQLKLNNWKFPVSASYADATKSLLENDSSDLKFLDFPSSSILHLKRKWKDGFNKAFESKPKLVMWTDTSVTYPISIHGPKYSKELDYPIETKQDYIKGISAWLYSTFGYSIKRAAFRANNAVYLAAIPGQWIVEFKHFPKEENETGFVIKGREKGNILDYI